MLLLHSHLLVSHGFLLNEKKKNQSLIFSGAIGVAIYFYSPLWTFSVTTQVALDGSPPVLLDLRDYSQPYVDNGPETVQSSVVWSQTGLADTQHALMVSVGAGQTFAIMDALVYVPSIQHLPTSVKKKSQKKQKIII